MKKIFLFSFLVFFLAQIWSQEVKYVKIPMVGQEAPSFNAVSTNGNINFPGDYGRTWKLLFSHPQDFTPVCTSELLEFAYAQKDFQKLNVSLVGISTDPISQHIQWKKAMEEINYQGRGTVKINFPIIDDDKLVVSREYGMIHPESNTTKDVRSVFIIDPDNIIQAMLFYPMNVGRNIEELERTVIALQTARNYKVATPANWEEGKDVLLPVKPVTDKEKEGTTEVAWFMTFKKLK